MDKGKTEQELATVEAMLRLYCKGQHAHKHELCAECRDLLDYARKRVSICPQADDKPTCRLCKIHCFKPEYREKMREVMRYAGPRMALRHPLRAIKHIARERGAPSEE